MTDTNRRRFLEAAVVTPFALGAGCLASEEPADHPITEPVTSWPSFRGRRFNTGLARGVAPTSSDPTIEWTADTGGPIWSSPVVARGTVYVGSADGSLYAIDAETGDERWTFDTDHRVEATPAYAEGSDADDASGSSQGGTVYVGSYDRRLYAVDSATGDLRWRRDLGGLLRGSPTVYEGSVLVGVGCHNLACAQYADGEEAENGWIYSLDAGTGETNWRYDVGDEVVSTPAVVDGSDPGSGLGSSGGGRVYVGASDDVMYALDATSGDVEWTYEADDMIWSSPAVAFGTVYFGDWDGIVHAVDAASGDPEWTVDTFGHSISGSVAVDDEAVYVGHTPINAGDDPGLNYGEVFAFDRATGEERWSFETDSLEIGSSPVVTDDRLYVGTHQQTGTEGVGVYGLTTDGEEEWFLEIEGRGVGSSPALVDGTLYVGANDGRVYAIQ